MMTVQQIADAVWTEGTRELLDPGTAFGSPETYLEEVCKAIWENAERTLTSSAIPSGSGDLSVVASTTATGSTVASGSGELAAVGEIAAVGYATASGSAALYGVGALEAAGYRVSEGSAQLIAIGTFAAAGAVEEVGGGAIIPSLGGRFFRRGGKPQFLGAMAFRR